MCGCVRAQVFGCSGVWATLPLHAGCIGRSGCLGVDCLFFVSFGASMLGRLTVWEIHNWGVLVDRCVGDCVLTCPGASVFGSADAEALECFRLCALEVSAFVCLGIWAFVCFSELDCLHQCEFDCLPTCWEVEPPPKEVKTPPKDIEPPPKYLEPYPRNRTPPKEVEPPPKEVETPH